MTGARLLLALLVASSCPLASCGRDAETRPSPPREAPVASPAPLASAPDVRPAPIVFDTTEPAPPSVEIPVRPPPPAPRPAPPPAPPPPTTAPGSCDVRETESFCFAYTGAGWTVDDAEAQCREAPSSRYLTGACPTAGRIATCTFRRPSDPTLEVVYTYYAPHDLGLAEVACPGEFERVR